MEEEGMIANDFGFFNDFDLHLYMWRLSFNKFCVIDKFEYDPN